MAVLDVTSYANLARDANGAVIASPHAANIDNQQITIAATSASVTLPTWAKFVRLHAEAACRVSFDGAASATSMRMSAGQTEYFGVIPGGTVAAIQA